MKEIIQWSFNRKGEVLPKELAIGRTIYSCTFFKEIKKDFQYDFLYWLLHLKLFLYLKVCFYSIHCLFNSDFYWQTHVLLICKHFLIKTTFSVHIQSSINFTWFTLVSHPKFDDRYLFKPGALRFATILNSLKTNIVRLK